MQRPELPDVPDVVPFEDEPAKQVLRDWALAYAVAYSCYVNAELIKQRDRASDDASRLRFPDTMGS